ncbi:SPOR domain-containing protein [Parahaliea mediterranea]|uniref:SPOR domain-containing protein n=1 Tax=Parahaliea mediterranea TaxID=651086 RepID=UPI000E2EA67C|nr:SPOR domain-containing protein [Parahaliea mediterranea]
MNNVLKQRLVGALILVALGVVFWPIIFVEPDTGARAPVVRMPPPPAIDTTPLPSPDKVGLRTSPPLDSPEDIEQDSAPGDRLGDANQPVPEANQPSSEGQGEGENQGELGPPAEPAAPVAEPAEATKREASAEATAEPDVAARAREERPVQPQTDAQGIPIAWTLQVVSVSNKERAEQTRQRLDAMGHKAYIKVAEVEGRKLYRVYVGPKFERARLDGIQADIDRQFGVKSMVRRYYP